MTVRGDLWAVCMVCTPLCNTLPSKGRRVSSQILLSLRSPPVVPLLPLPSCDSFLCLQSFCHGRFSMGYYVVFVLLPPLSSWVLSVSPGVWLPPPFGLPVPNLGLCDVYVLHSCSLSGPASRLRIPFIRFRSVSSNTIHDPCYACHPTIPHPSLPHPLSTHILHYRRLASPRLATFPLTNCYVPDPCYLPAVRRVPRTACALLIRLRLHPAPSPRPPSSFLVLGALFFHAL
ncbi:hypothetical protein C8Q70DRAFT_497199 [Cubamyces menziesii]|nr:hypothetical protein C8Q70DRAFT_497199 [Cubamyces menziesii]